MSITFPYKWNTDERIAWQRTLSATLRNMHTEALLRPVDVIIGLPSLVILWLLAFLFEDSIHVHARLFSLLIMYTDREILLTTCYQFYLWISGFAPVSAVVYQLIWTGNILFGYITSAMVCYWLMASILAYSSSVYWRIGATVVLRVVSTNLATVITKVVKSPVVAIAVSDALLLEFKRKATRNNMLLRRSKFPLQAPPYTRPYRYSPLQHGQIRLLQIAELGSRLRYSFKIVTLLDNPDVAKYVALSYVWGEKEDPPRAGITIDGCWMPVSSNVYELVHERAGDWGFFQPHYIWIDSLCINQTDMLEKSLQVGMMNVIYTKAIVVAGYIRPASHEESDVAVYFLDSLAKDLRQRRKRTYGLLPRVVGRTVASFFDGFVAAGTGKGPSAGWNAVANLTANKYWTRAWIVQELVLAPTALRLFYGDHELDWTALAMFDLEGPTSGFVDFTYSFQVATETFSDSNNRLRRTFGLRSQIQRNAQVSTDEQADGGDEQLSHPLKMTDMLLTIRNMDATDPRDRVYAFYGLDESLKARMPITYDPPDASPESIARLYTATAGYFALQKDPEWLLAVAGVGYSTLIDSRETRSTTIQARSNAIMKFTYSDVPIHLPSWVPDFRSPYPPPLPSICNRTDEQIAQRRSQIHASKQVHDGFEGLSVKAVYIDKIKTITEKDLFPTKRNLLNGTEDDALANIRRPLQVYDVVKSSIIRPSHVSVEERFCRTITAGVRPLVAGEHVDLLPSFLTYLRIMEELRPTIKGMLAGNVSSFLSLRTFAGLSDADNNRWEGCTDVCDLRNVIITERGHFALVPRLAQVGDYIYRLNGTETYLVLRRSDTGITFQLIGHCYVEGTEEYGENDSSIGTILIG
jgi:hypothetical protein